MQPGAVVEDRATIEPVRNNLIARHGQRLMIALILVASAVISYLTTNSLISLAMFGVSLLMVVVVAVILRDLQQHPEHARWLVPLTILTLVGIQVFSRIGRVQELIFHVLFRSGKEWVGL